MRRRSMRPDPPLECDIVMRGGVTAGIAYPGAVSEIAALYRLRSIGGTSAGALAAGAAAAMEFGRTSRRNPAAARQIAGIAGQLAEERGGRTLLSRLLEPVPSTRPAYELLMALLDRRWTRAIASKAGRALVLPLVVIPAVIFGALGALVWLYVEGVNPSGSAVEIVQRGLMLVAAVLLLTIFVAIVQVRWGIVARWLERTLAPVVKNGYGIASGWDGGQSSLAGWAHRVVQQLAGLPVDQPLTFGDLWAARYRGRGVAREAAFAAACAATGVNRNRLSHCPRDIDLKLITSDLNRRAMMQLPFANDSLYAQLADLERLFPSSVVRWMVRRAGPACPYPGGAGLIRLPRPEDLPVLFAMRLSMSFPFLISSVPLFVVRKMGESRHELAEIWLADGGIASNFPIHLFDSPVPGRPTLCLNLVDHAEELASADEEGQADGQYLRRIGSPEGDRNRYLYMPKTNQGQIGLLKRLSARSALSGIGEFLGLVFDTARLWNDNMSMEVPGFRDRIINIWLDADDNAFDFRMPADRIHRLDEKGRKAGELIARRFVPGETDDPLRPGTDLQLGWNNHRFVRFRASLAAFEIAADRFAAAWKGQTKADKAERASSRLAVWFASLESLAAKASRPRRRRRRHHAQARPTYRQMLARAGRPGEPVPGVGFTPVSEAQRTLLERMSHILAALAALSRGSRTQADFVNGEPTSPRRKPTLRARPALDNDPRDQRLV